MPALNFPPIEARFSKGTNGEPRIFDIVRKKFVDLTPEEWVRQHLIHFLVYHRQYPVALIGVEKQLKLNNTLKRTDVVVYNTALKPLLLVECKAPAVALDQAVVDQALRYNIPLQVPYVLLSNGLQHVCVTIQGQQVSFMETIPAYPEL
ncbi:MAG: type I restriction enzyme HsdR N-terminal domain-containing protein [Bacteroidetes bacterium]|nr:type I restriction enzyme HsdR N-terminal domain-containing protein [Bacteroidota bacterium]